MTSATDTVQPGLHIDNDRGETMFDLVLRHPATLDEQLLDEPELGPAIPKLIAVAAGGIGAWGAVVGGTAGYLVEEIGPVAALTVPAAMIAALFGALCICLPSFYFYTQLSGLDASFRLITAQALKVLATTAVLLLGALPIHAVLALGAGLGWLSDPMLIFNLGLMMPFVFGLRGIQLLYRGFVSMTDRLPITHRRRGDFVRRMVLCWGALYTVVAPVALWRLLSALGLG